MSKFSNIKLALAVVGSILSVPVIELRPYIHEKGREKIHCRILCQAKVTKCKRMQKAAITTQPDLCTIYTTPGELHGSKMTSIIILLRGVYMNKSEGK